jgi:uncharacterized cupredoxin-like copper-binding protein
MASSTGFGTRHLLGFAAGLTLATAACAAPPPATPQSTANSAPLASGQVVRWEALDYGFNAPASMAGGLTTIQFSNIGQEPHHAQLLRLNDGVSFEQLLSAFQQEGEAALRFTTVEGGAGAVGPGHADEVTLDLKPGTYALLCLIPSPDGVPHLAKDMLQPLQVTAPSTTAAAAPAVAGTFTMKDFTFVMPESLPAGKTTYRVVNEGPQVHELNIIRLAPGKTLEAARQFFLAPAGPPPFEAVGGINAFDKSGAGYMTLELTPGEYAAICNVPDPVSGRPHLHLGMIKAFSVK